MEGEDFPKVVTNCRKKCRRRLADNYAFILVCVLKNNANFMFKEQAFYKKREDKKKHGLEREVGEILLTTDINVSKKMFVLLDHKINIFFSFSF